MIRDHSLKFFYKRTLISPPPSHRLTRTRTLIVAERFSLDKLALQLQCTFYLCSDSSRVVFRFQLGRPVRSDNNVSGKHVTIMSPKTNAQFIDLYWFWIKDQVNLGQGIQEWTKYNLWKAPFKKVSLLMQTILLQIFWRLSSINFTWSILKYLDPFELKAYDLTIQHFQHKDIWKYSVQFHVQFVVIKCLLLLKPPW